MIRAIIFLVLCVRCFATSVTIAWDKNPEAEIAYTLEAKPGAELDPGEWKAVASTHDLFITLTTLTPGQWSFRVIAVTLDGSVPSAPSEVVSGIVRPDKPKGVRIVLESSRDMEAWEPVATYEVPEAARAFYRIAFTEPP